MAGRVSTLSRAIVGALDHLVDQNTAPEGRGAAMNKKQRLLTIIALVAFALIGACHYLAWPPLVLYEQKWFFLTVWKELTYEEAQQQVHDRDLNFIFAARLLEQGGYTDSKGQVPGLTEKMTLATSPSLA